MSSDTEMPGPGAALARSADPETSHMAASEVASNPDGVKRLQALAFGLIQENPGLTATELAAKAGIADPRVINRRLSELHDAEMICVLEVRWCSITGRMARSWIVGKPDADNLPRGTNLVSRLRQEVVALEQEVARLKAKMSVCTCGASRQMSLL